MELGLVGRERYVLAIDQGTTRTKAALFDEEGKVRGFGSVEVKRTFPRPTWVEQNPDQIWDSILTAVRTAMRSARCRPKQIVGVGLDNQGETVVAWNKESGAPLYNAIVWQCRRTNEICERL
ncbi:MAG TPA: FGGY family carbohydrate kinase, partial [Candidatus Saccharimonadales bacterium]|nr:FGGY family carbohydrate kinase [Candidatus Saccharimonadales bacterium]